ncbi:MAG: DUF2130 domain-containing protein [Candidatus Gracilibacteria bacterium]|nr:DUF2130 domain-containing protein [Candidatus Gracilibacteria bacterium]
MSQTIKCPNCSEIIDLDKIGEEKYKHMLEEQELQLKKEQIAKEKEFEKTLEDKTNEMRKKAVEFAKEEAEKQKKKDAVEMEDLKNRLKEADNKQEEFQKQELEMRKKQRELEEQAKNQELDLARKMDEEKKKITEEMAKNQDEVLEVKMKDIQEEFRKKELEYQKQQEQLKKSLDDAKRKAEQGSQQIQGDIQEDDLKNAISQAFPIDNIEDVPTGIKGADLIQTVNNHIGQNSGTIVWESKNTKSWTDSWIMKLKEDKLKVNGNIAILVTTVLPKSVKNFGMVDDVMVCLPEYVIAVSGILRDKLLSISKVETSLQGKDIKMEMLYKYLSSEEFSGKISMMVDVFANLKGSIDAERRAMEKNWKKREKDLERATFAVTGMYGELESLMGQALPGAEKLELGYGEEE